MKKLTTKETLELLNYLQAGLETELSSENTLKLVIDASTSSKLQEVATSALEGVKAGKTLTVALSETEALPRILARTLEFGESTDKLREFIPLLKTTLQESEEKNSPTQKGTFYILGAFLLGIAVSHVTHPRTR